VNNTRRYARVSHSTQWSNYNIDDNGNIATTVFVAELKLS